MCGCVLSVLSDGLCQVQHDHVYDLSVDHPHYGQLDVLCAHVQLPVVVFPIKKKHCNGIRVG